MTPHIVPTNLKYFIIYCLKFIYIMLAQDIENLTLMSFSASVYGLQIVIFVLTPSAKYVLTMHLSKKKDDLCIVFVRVAERAVLWQS